MRQGRIVVIGGGASGLAAAIAAAYAGRGAVQVTVLEKSDRVGKKLLATGNGRCNLSNTNASPAFYHTNDVCGLEQVLGAQPPAAVLSFFEALGLLCEVLPDGRVYPYCYQASMVLDVLRAAVERNGVQVMCGADVRGIRQAGQGKKGLLIETEDSRVFLADKAILAAGGQAAPQLGTNGAGFALARLLGHSVLPVRPGLVPLRCEPVFPELKGVRAGAAVSLYCAGKCLRTERGEVQFTEYGLSGIAVMQLSGLVSEREMRSCGLSVDLFPDMPYKRLRALLEERRAGGDFPTLETFLLGLVAKKLGHAVLKGLGLVPLSRRAAALSAAELDALAGCLKGWRFAVTATQPWAQAQVTVGGVPLSEVEAGSCASRRCPGLYLAGEVLDAAGDCGGFNLQWAWATGILAGRSAAESLLRQPGR